MPGDEPDTRRRCDWPLIFLVAGLVFLILLSLIWQLAQYAASGQIDALKPWQTALAALTGFAGVIVTTGLGFFLSIRAREHQADIDRKRERDQLSREAKALATVLQAEMAGVRERLNGLQLDCEELTKGGTFDNMLTKTVEGAEAIFVPGFTLYKANAERLGILGSSLAEHVVISAIYADRVANLGTHRIYPLVAKGDRPPKKITEHVERWAYASAYLLRYCGEELRRFADGHENKDETATLEEGYERFIACFDEDNQERFRRLFPPFWRD